MNHWEPDKNQAAGPGQPPETHAPDPPPHPAAPGGDSGTAAPAKKPAEPFPYPRQGSGQSKVFVAAWLGALALCLGLLAWQLYGLAAPGGLAGLETARKYFLQYFGEEKKKPVARPGPAGGDPKLAGRQAAALANLMRERRKLKSEPDNPEFRAEFARAGLSLAAVAREHFRQNDERRGDYALGILAQGVMGEGGRAARPRYRLHEQKHRFVRGPGGGRGLVVSGQVELVGQARPVSAVLLQGVLMSQNRTILAKTFSLAGRLLPDMENLELSRPGAMARLLRQPARGEVFKPGSRIYYQLYFAPVPAGAKRYLVSVALAR